MAAVIASAASNSSGKVESPSSTSTGTRMSRKSSAIGADSTQASDSPSAR